jgi:hypothetical protein
MPMMVKSWLLILAVAPSSSSAARGHALAGRHHCAFGLAASIWRGAGRAHQIGRHAGQVFDRAAAGRAVERIELAAITSGGALDGVVVAQQLALQAVQRDGEPV